MKSIFLFRRVTCSPLKIDSKCNTSEEKNMSKLVALVAFAILLQSGVCNLSGSMIISRRVNVLVSPPDILCWTSFTYLYV